MSPVYANVSLRVRAKKPDIRITGVTLEPSQVLPGGEVRVYATIDNLGGRGDATMTAALETESISTTLRVPKKGGVYLLGVMHAPMKPGSYNVEVVPVSGCSGQATAVLTVSAPTAPRIVLDSFSVSSTRVNAGDSVTISATFKNEGNADGISSYAIKVGEVVVTSGPLSLSPGATQTVSTTHVLRLPGNNKVSIVLGDKEVATQMVTVIGREEEKREEVVVVQPVPTTVIDREKKKEGWEVQAVTVERKYYVVRFEEGASDFKLRFDPSACVDAEPGKVVETTVYWETDKFAWVAIYAAAIGETGEVLSPAREVCYRGCLGFSSEKVNFVWRWPMNGVIVISVKDVGPRYERAAKAKSDVISTIASIARTIARTVARAIVPLR